MVCQHRLRLDAALIPVLTAGSCRLFPHPSSLRVRALKEGVGSVA